MKKDIAKKWVEALRSGKYVQGKGTLINDGNHCCLGVLCEISGFGGSGDHGWQQYGSLPKDVRQWSGMGTVTGILPGSGEFNELSLVTLNDKAGATFDEIADIIQMTWEEL